MKITICICTWNNARQLQETLASLAELSIPAAVECDILVIDNNSSDQTPRVLSSYCGPLPMRSLFEPKQGKSNALNLAIDKLDCDWVLWTDDDIRYRSDWVSRYVDAIANHKDAAFFAGPIKAVFEVAKPDWLERGWAELKHVYGERDFPADATQVTNDLLPWGANFAIRTSTQKCYSYDARLGRRGRQRIGGEEISLSAQLLRDGHIGYFIPEADVSHVIPKSAVNRAHVRRYLWGQGMTAQLKSFDEKSVKKNLKATLIATRAHLRSSLPGRPRSEISQATAFRRKHVLTGRVVQDLKNELSKFYRAADRKASKLALNSGSKPPLIQAAISGDYARLEKLLKTCQDCTVTDASGRTALHHAVRQKNFAAASLLLHHDINWKKPDNRGLTALSLEFTDRPSLHAIKQHYRRQPTETIELQNDKYDQALRDLEQDGFARIGKILDGPTLKRLQSQFDTFVGELEQDVAAGKSIYRHYDEEKYWMPKDLAYVTNNAFKHIPDLVGWQGLTDVADLVNSYYGRRAYVTRANAMRYLPCESRENDMFGWHHDMEDKRLKVMILLSDVERDDQAMNYVNGSHRPFHPYQMFFRNAFTLDSCRELVGEIEISRTIGKAGDVFAFDSNGAHRGQRSATAATRDAIFLEFSHLPSDVWGGDVRLKLAATDPLSKLHPLWYLKYSKKKWESPKRPPGAPTWMLDLDAPERWLGVTTTSAL